MKIGWEWSIVHVTMPNTQTEPDLWVFTYIFYACGESGEHGKCTDVNPRVLSHVGRAQWEGGGRGRLRVVLRIIVDDVIHFSLIYQPRQVLPITMYWR